MNRISAYGLIIFLTIMLSHTAHAQKSKVTIDSLKGVLNNTKEDTIKVNVLNDIAYEYVTTDSASATKFATDGLQLAQKINYKKGIMGAHNILGLALYYTNHYDAALQQYNLTKEIAIQLGDHLKQASALNNIGLVYDDRADYDKALQYYFQSLKLIESIRESKETKRQLSFTLNNIALIYQGEGKYDEALEFHNRALKLKQEIGNRKGVGSSLHNIAMVYKLKGDYAKSLEYYFKALEVRKANNDEQGTALTLNNIGNVYEAENLYDKAFIYLQQSYDIRMQLKDNYNLAINLLSLGGNYYHRKDYKNAVEYTMRALKISEELGAKELLKTGYETLAIMYSDQKNFEQAFKYEKLFTEIKDSILNSETTKHLSELQTRYDSEKKEKEIELLTKDGEIQSLQLNKNKLWLWMLLVAVLLVFSLAGLFYNRYKLKQKANVQLEHRNTEMAQQKKEITDSINYAKRIQESILPPDEHWKKILPHSFIFYRPKDIVSGDFYWIEQKKEIICFAAVDCTGHGVPGALMSVVGFNLLTQAVNEMDLTVPSEILKHLDYGVTKTLHQSEDGKGVKDGMDLSLCSLNTITNELQYAGAFNSLYYISNGIFQEIKADKFPIGVNLDGKVDDYKNHTIQLHKGDSVYLFSDGYADQFGGSKGKKFKYNQLKELLMKIHQLPLDEQKQAVASIFDTWKGNLEQVDDVVIIGVRI